MCDQGAAIALTQKLLMIVDEQLKSSHSCKKLPGHACGTTSSGCTSEKTSSGKTHDHPYFSSGVKNKCLYLFMITSFLFLAKKRLKIVVCLIRIPSDYCSCHMQQCTFLFGLRNEVVHQLSSFLCLVCELEWFDPSLPHSSHIITTITKDGVIPPKFMESTHDVVVPQAQHSLVNLIRLVGWLSNSSSYLSLEP